MHQSASNSTSHQLCDQFIFPRRVNHTAGSLVWVRSRCLQKRHCISISLTDTGPLSKSIHTPMHTYIYTWMLFRKLVPSKRGPLPWYTGYHHRLFWMISKEETFFMTRPWCTSTWKHNPIKYKYIHIPMYILTSKHVKHTSHILAYVHMYIHTYRSKVVSAVYQWYLLPRKPVHLTVC